MGVPGGARLEWVYLGGARLEEANLEWEHLVGEHLAGAYLGNLRISQIVSVDARKAELVIKQGCHFDEVMTGCFRGTLVVFEEAVRRTHGDNQFGREYLAFIAAIRASIEAGAAP